MEKFSGGAPEMRGGLRPEAIIFGIANEIRQMGNNDSENDRINQILAGLQSGQYSPEEAIRMAVSLRDSKIDH